MTSFTLDDMESLTVNIEKVKAIYQYQRYNFEKALECSETDITIADLDDALLEIDKTLEKLRVE
jgi:hypothetical protein